MNVRVSEEVPQAPLNRKGARIYKVCVSEATGDLGGEAEQLWIATVQKCSSASWNISIQEIHVKL